MLTIEKNASTIKKDQSYYVFENFYDNKIAQIMSILYAPIYNNLAAAPHNITNPHPTRNSALTNKAPLAAWQSLNSLKQQLETSGENLTAGVKIAKPEDNIAYWGFSNTLRSDTRRLLTVRDALDSSRGQIKQAYIANQQIRKELNNIKKQTAALSRANNNNLAARKKHIESSLFSIKAAIQNASLGGLNLLANDENGFFELIASFARTGETIKLNKIKLKKSDLALATQNNELITFDKGKLKTLFKISQKFLSNSKPNQAADFSEFAQTIEIALAYINKIDIILASAEKQIDSQIDLLQRLKNSLSQNLGALIEANLDAEAARHAALNIQQKLAMQALFLANQSPMNIYRKPGLAKETAKAKHAYSPQKVLAKSA